MLKDYFSLAFENLKHRGLRSWLTMLGIFIGIAAVVALISLGAGLQQAITEQFGSLSVDKLTIQNKGVSFAPPGSTVIEKLNDNDVRIIESINGVKKVITRLLRICSLEYNKVSKFGYVIDIPEEEESMNLAYEAFNFESEEGRLLKPGDSRKVLLGHNFLETEDFEKKLQVGKKVKINGKDFEIIGFLKKSSNFQINSVVFLMRHDLEELLDIENEYDLIIVQVEDKDDIEEVAEKIEEKLRRNRNEDEGEESFSVETPIQSLNAVNTVLNIINLIVIGIAGISLFVGGVGIANTMYTSVLERTKEIGVMKAIGAKNSDIMWIFLIEAGAVIGLGAAIGVSSIANTALKGNLFIVSISYPLLIGAIAFSFLVGIISGVLPAIQASKLNVVDALRS